MVQKMFWLCTKKNGTKTDESLQGESGHNKVWKDVETYSRFLKKAEFLLKKRENGKLKDKKEGLPEKNLEDCGMRLRSEASWLEKSCGMLPRKTCWKTEDPYLKKTAISCGNIWLCMKKTFSAAGCERMSKGEKQKWERLNEEAKQEERNSGKREVERDGERVEIKRRCWRRVSSDVLRGPLSCG